MRMLSLSGGSRELLEGAKNLRCQVCCMVRPPQSRPQVSYLKPSNFNQKISGDCFHVWDVENVKYTVVHFIDELTDYQVGALALEMSAGFVAKVLRLKWYDVFGPPDVLVTDGGTEFQGHINYLNELFAVQHEVVPDQAKWRLGHTERHGAILKLMIMKIVQSLRIDNLEEMTWAMTSAVASKNRLVNDAGISPLQAVTGRNAPLPASLLAQISAGRIKFKANEELEKDEALRRAERIRAAAVEACHWLDAHQGLRRALASRSRPPHLEMLREGCVVYVYDPPISRKGLARRLQDNISWAGPGVVVCVERELTTPKRIWVRIRTKVKAYPLEKIRLATADEMIGAEFITNALKDLQAELEGGRMEVATDPGAVPLALEDEPRKKRGKNEQIAEETPPVKKVKETPAIEDKPITKALSEKQARRRELLHDLPQSMVLSQQAASSSHAPGEVDLRDPHAMTFSQKTTLFELMAKEKGKRPCALEAQLRAELEDAKSSVRKVRKTLKEKAQERSRQAGAVDHDLQVHDIDGEREVFFTVPGGWNVIDGLVAFWNREELSQDLKQKTTDNVNAVTKETQEAQLVTGKLRVEMRWQDLDEDWRQAFHDPLLKAVQIYFDYNALGGVEKDQVVDPRKILPSRFVLTNKGGKKLVEALLKARWVLGGHRDEAVGRYPTMAPTSSLLGHNLLNFIAVQNDWVVHYEDVASAFLQGKPLPEDREVYVRIPAGYPQYVVDYILKQLGAGKNYRGDLLRLLKGGFGLAESPRLWYLEYKATLEDIGLHELKLVPGMFRAFHPDGSLRALVTIHVDDTRYAGDESAQGLWDELHARLRFGKLRKATEGWQKFCGRWEKQDIEKGEMRYSMDEYTVNIP